MESNQEQKTPHEGGCCRRGSCCGCKAVAALLLLLIGGIIGFFLARPHCRRPSAMCPMHDMGMMGMPQPMPVKHPGK